MLRKKILVILAVAVLLLVAHRFDLAHHLTLSALKSHHRQLAELYVSHPATVVVTFMAVYVLQTALSLPGAAVLSLAAGAIFGTVMGTVYATIAATMGATAAFLVTRHLLLDVVQRKWESRLAKLNAELDAQGVNYLLFLRLIPLFPFFLVNLAAGMTRLPLSTFVAGTAIGIIPGAFVFCNAGANLATVRSVQDVLGVNVILSLVLLGMTALLPALYRKVRQRNIAPQDPS